MNKTKKLCYIAMLTALYVVLSAFLKVSLIGNIMLDLGYIAFAVALDMFGIWGVFVGAVGCSIESILFSAYGFSISWFVANLIIGLGCGIVFERTKHFGIRVITILGFTALGVLIAKSAIECYLYQIPLTIKIPKNFTAFSIDSCCMVLGLIIKARLRVDKTSS